MGTEENKVAAAFGLAVREKLARGENWTIRDLAQARGMHPKTIAKQVRLGLIAKVRGTGRTVRVAAREAARVLGETEAAR